jgi:hypothetical protein
MLENTPLHSMTRHDKTPQYTPSLDIACHRMGSNLLACEPVVALYAGHFHRVHLYNRCDVIQLISYAMLCYLR